MEGTAESQTQKIQEDNIRTIMSWSLAAAQTLGNLDVFTLCKHKLFLLHHSFDLTDSVAIVLGEGSSFQDKSGHLTF